jgi:type VI secretion system protein ImpM
MSSQTLMQNQPEMNSANLNTKTVDVITGYCGKIPSLGDFVSLGLDNSLEQSWNEWVQAALAVSREKLQGTWLDNYLTSPIWHFAVSAGVCADRSFAGTLIPSVDNVGRYYPFTLFYQADLDPLQFWQQQAFFQQNEQQLLTILDDNCVLLNWYKKLAPLSLEVVPITPYKQTLLSPNSHQPNWLLTASAGADAGSSDQLGLLQQTLNQQFNRYSIWWTAGSEHMDPCTLIFSGMPTAGTYAGMLDGNWTRS